MTARTLTFICKSSDKGFYRLELVPGGELAVFRIVAPALPIATYSGDALAQGGALISRVPLAAIRRVRLARERFFDGLELTLDGAGPGAAALLQLRVRAAELGFHSFLAELTRLLPSGVTIADEVYSDDLADRHQTRRYASGAGSAESVTRRSVILVRWWFLFAITLAFPPLAVAMWLYVMWLTLRRFLVVTSAEGIVVRGRFRNRRLRWDELQRVEVREVQQLGQRYLYLELVTADARIPVPTSGVDGTRLIRELQARGVPLAPPVPNIGLLVTAEIGRPVFAELAPGDAS